MRKVYPLALLFLLLSPSGYAQSDQDRADILDAFESWDSGWAQRDVELAIQDYAEDVDWTNAFGDRFQGKEKLREGLAFIFSLPFVMEGESGKNEYTDIRFLSSDIAIVRSKLFRKGQETSEGAVMPDRRINHLRVFEKREGKWLIVTHLISQEHEKR